jgi:hypothetical protein
VLQFGNYARKNKEIVEIVSFRQADNDAKNVKIVKNQFS